jgi:tight adherence protein C
MESDELMLYGLIGVAVVAVLVACVALLSRKDPLKQRIAAMEQSDEADFTSTHWLVRIAPISQRLARFASPEGGDSSIGLRMLNAGLRGESATSFYYAAKTGLMLALPLLAWFLLPGTLSMTMLGLSLLGAAALGMYLPGMVLNSKIKGRKAKLLDGLPDALEMMRVCVEAGLGFDAAMTRVTRELGQKSPELQQEFELTLHEVNAGSSRDAALRKLALRTDLEDVVSLTTMLIQADRFGISVGDALKTYTKELRVRRQQRGEEKAAKLSVQLLIPMTLFVFPAMFGVLLGPGVLNIIHTLLPTMSGG